MEKNINKPRTMCFRFDSDSYEKIKSLSDEFKERKLKMTMATLINYAVAEFLDRNPTVESILKENET